MEKNHNRNIQIIGAVAVVLISLLIGLYINGVPDLDFNVFGYGSGDPMLGRMLVKSLRENGIKGIFYNSRIGAPEGSNLIDSPFLDLNYILKVLFFNLFTANENATLYLLYISTFVTSALVMYLVCGMITGKVYLKILLAIIYSVTPYHLLRGMGHLSLANCGIVPIGIYVAYRIAKGHDAEKDKKVEILILFVLSFIAGSGNIYYGFFSFILYFIATLCNVISKKNVRDFGIFLSCYVGCILGMAVNIAPKIIHEIIAGPNTDSSIRGAMQTDFYGLRISQLFLPIYTIKKEWLAGLTAKYNTEYSEYVNENMLSALGLVASVSLIVFVVRFIYSYISGKNEEFLNTSFLFLLGLFVYNSVGGVGTLVSCYVTPQFRALNRVSIFIVAIVLLGVGYILDRLSESSKWPFIVLIVIMTGVTVYEDIGAPPKGFQVAAIESDRILKDFFSKVEANLPVGASVYELPYVDYPEVPPVYNMMDYSEFSGYVYTDKLKWSYGGIKGRNYAAKNLYVDDGMSEEFVQGIIDAGFDAVYIDSDAYEDGASEINRFYSEILGLDQLVSENGKLFCYKLDGSIWN